MISAELKAQIRHLFHAEHWKVGTLATELGLHPDTVRRALETERFRRGPSDRNRLTDPYLDFLRQTLQQYPRLRATRVFQMLEARGYQGSVVQLRRVVAQLRPRHREAFLHLEVFPGEQGQADWACFGQVTLGQARRRLSAFVVTLSYSRALWLEFFFDQSLESFLLGHLHAFHYWGGAPRVLLVDNLRSVVLERLGQNVRFHPRWLELAAHYHFATRPCAPARGNEKGRAERSIQYARSSFFAARPFTTLEDFNRQALQWCQQVAQQRPWPGGQGLTVAEAFAQEKPRLLPLPAHLFDCQQRVMIRSGKTIYVRFDLNDYSIPPEAVGRSLTLWASPTTVRLLDGTAEIARHRRCYDRGQRVNDPAHLEALLASKRKALASTATGRLAVSIPAAARFLEAAFQRGESVATQTAQLLRLVEDYGAAEVTAAAEEALQRGTPRASTVAFLLHQRQRASRRQPLFPVRLSTRPELETLVVPHPQLEAYDELSNPEDDSQS
ncbi:MAG: IS21 family transposase [Terriglobales bacterium]